MLDPGIFKSYDARGLYPSQLDEAGAEAIARAFAKVVNAKTVVVARDVRASGPALAAAATEALLAAGVNVLDIGVVSTDMFYFAVATLPVDGGFTISASHNPKDWNGFNFCRRGAQPLSLDSGLKAVRDRALAEIQAGGPKAGAGPRGRREERDLWAAFADYVLSYVDRALIPPVRLVADGNCGMQVKVLRRVVEQGRLPIEIIARHGEPDGTFPVPGGVPNPLLPENHAALCAAVREQHADLGAAWDADGDRCFFVDGSGYFLSGYFATAILARSILRRTPGATIVIDPRSIWATQETIAELGGKTVLSRAGMTIIPDKMQESGAEFGGEMSAHFYFRRNWFRDNGMIPLLILLELLGREHKRLEDFVRPLRAKYFASGEINFEVEDPAAVVTALTAQFRDGEQDFTDGLSVAYADWRFNLRPSNTEPLLRLNVEARSEAALRAGEARLRLAVGHNEA
ncbi:MAG: phosphomannomutase/phosphoglucomutase [Terriglobales bacterium]